MRKTNRKKKAEMIKNELQASILEVSDKENANLNEEVKNTKEVKEGISLVKKYENLLKGANKKSSTLLGNRASSSKHLRKRMNFFTMLV